MGMVAARWSRASSMTLMLGIGAAHAAVPGLPEAPRPGPLPTVWASWANDTFDGEIGETPDDLRTNAFTAGVRLGRAVLVIDDSLLTDRGFHDPHRGRSDEVTATAGALLIDDRLRDGWSARLAAGAGGRWTGDFGGESLQNGWHRRIGEPEVAAPYESADPVALGWLDAAWLQTGGLPRVPLLAGGQLGLEARAGGLATIGDERQARAAARLVLLGHDGWVHLGAVHDWRDGTPATHTAARVAAEERGTWIEYGMGAGALGLSFAVNLDHDLGAGALSWSTGRRPVVAGEDHAAEVEGGIGLYAGYALGWQYRWRPGILVRALGGRCSALVDYRYGRERPDGWDDTHLVARQGLVGLELAAAAPRGGVQAIPFLYLGGGIRQEFVSIVGDRPRFGEQDAVAPVVQGGVGMRFAAGELPRPGREAPRYALAVTYDGWLPLREAALVEDPSERYLRPALALGGRISALVRW
jgi:hypothetical protein